MYEGGYTAGQLNSSVMKMVDPRTPEIPDVILELVPASIIFESKVLPLRDDGERIVLFCPLDPDFQLREGDRLSFLLGREIEWIPVDRRLLEEAIYDRFPLADADVANCPPTFLYKCPRTWQMLEKTDQPRIRNCQECGRTVTWTDDPSEAKRLALTGQCVAFSDARTAETLGMIDFE